MRLSRALFMMVELFVLFHYSPRFLGICNMTFKRSLLANTGTVIVEYHDLKRKCSLAKYFLVVFISNGLLNSVNLRIMLIFHCKLCFLGQSFALMIFFLIKNGENLT